MDLGLAGKVVLVTGAGRGLGQAIGLAFAGERAQVAFHYHSSADGAEAAAVNLMGDSGRVGRADDVTPMVLLLASPRAGWITGEVVSVNGGYAML